MKALLSTCGLAAAIVAVAFTGASSPADAQGAGPGIATFSITVTNLTRAQIFSPAIVATHNDQASMFTPGSAASSELQALAEDGDNTMVMSTLALDPNVYEVSPGMGMIHPGMSETILVSTDRLHQEISLASMLVSTNDTFVGLDTVRLPMKSSRLLAHAYDAGTEYNSEDCAYIPGPPCGNPGSHDPTPAEGFIYISNGLHGLAGIAGVPEETYDWRGPVARVEIKRL